MPASSNIRYEIEPHHTLVQCTSCNQPGFLESWPHIGSEHNPHARDLLLGGKLFKYTCPVCGTVTTMAYPCLYHDEVRQMLLLYAPDRNQQPLLQKHIDDLAQRIHSANDMLSDADVIQRRLAFTTFEFCEKARLWNEGYDDRVIELMKVAIKRGMLEEGIVGPRDILIYERTLENGGVSFIVTGEIPGDTVGVPQGYTYLKDAWLEKLDAITDEYCFDAAWANAFLP